MITSASAVDHGFPDHYPVFASLSVSKPSLPTREVIYRKLKNIDENELIKAIKSSKLSSSISFDQDLGHMIKQYGSELSAIFDDLAPLKSRTITVRPESKWYTTNIRIAKQSRRQAERLWRKTGLTVHRDLYIERKNHVNNLIDNEKVCHYRRTIEENQGNT